MTKVLISLGGSTFVVPKPPKTGFLWGFVLGPCFCRVVLGVLSCLAINLLSLPHGPVSWSVIVAFSGKTHLLFKHIPDQCSYKSLSKFIHSLF